LKGGNDDLRGRTWSRGGASFGNIKIHFSLATRKTLEADKSQSQSASESESESECESYELCSTTLTICY